MDLTSKYLKRFKKIKLHKADLLIDHSNYSESDSDEEIEEARSDLFVIDKTPISIQINRMPELLSDLPELNVISEKMTVKRNEPLLSMMPAMDLSFDDLNISSKKDPEAEQSSDQESNDSFNQNSPLNVEENQMPEAEPSDDDESDHSSVIDSSPVNVEQSQVPELLADLPEFKAIPEPTKTKRFEFPSQMEPGIDLNDTYLTVNPDKEPKEAINRLTQLTLKLAEKQQLLNKSVLKPGFEQQYTVPTYLESLRLKKKARKVEREKTKGDKWFNMPAPEMTEELKNDLKVLKMRKALDPKHFYKKDDRSVPPKYFQIGTVVEGAADFYHARVPKKDRKRTMVEELLADAEFQKFSKRKYAEVLASKPQRKGAQKHMKRLKKKKK